MTPQLQRKLIVLFAALLVIATVVWFILFTPTGRIVADHARLRELLANHPNAAPLIFMVIYTAVGCTMIPLWPLQGVAGYVFGPAWALVYCQVCNAISSFLTTAFSEWLITGISMAKVDPLLARLRHFQQRLGSTGIPLVMATRLVHFTPFGPANIAFGIMKLRPRDVAIGTLLGNCGSVGFYAILGAAGANLREDWRAMLKLIAALAVLNVVLLAPIAWRYWRSREIALPPN